MEKHIATEKSNIKQLRVRIKNKTNDLLPEVESLKGMINRCNGPPDIFECSTV